jgi:hypothetical protein
MVKRILTAIFGLLLYAVDPRFRRLVNQKRGLNDMEQTTEEVVAVLNGELIA